MFAFNQNQMHSKKEHILELEATQKTRRNDLRRAFNQRLLRNTALGAGAKRKGEGDAREEEGSTERLKN